MYKTIAILLMAVFLMGNTGCTEQELADAQKKLDTAQGVATTVGTTIPVTQPWATIVAGVLGIAGTIVGAVKSKKHKSRSDNYSEAIEIAMMEGDDKKAIDVAHLEKSLDKDTKAHFNATGGTTLN